MTENKQGKLKEKISAKFFQCLESDYIPITERLAPEDIEVNASINWDDLKTILDEAKAEFPRCDKCQYFTGNIDNGNCDRLINDEHLCSKDIWLAKWFGESP